MAAKTLVEKIQEDIVGTKDEVKEEEKKEGDTEMEETKEEVDEESKKGKRSRKGSAANKTGAAKDNKKKKSEPSSEEVVTPASERPTRERKTVERYSEPSPGRSVIKGFTIGKGRGTQLKDIPKGRSARATPRHAPVPIHLSQEYREIERQVKNQSKLQNLWIEVLKCSVQVLLKGLMMHFEFVDCAVVLTNKAHSMDIPIKL